MVLEIQAKMLKSLKKLKNYLESGLPIFAICLGHQLMALAHGFKTEKLKYGHHGANHPVKDLNTRACLYFYTKS